MHNVRTVPTYKTHNIGTELSYATLKLELDWIELKIEDVHENEDDRKIKTTENTSLAAPGALAHRLQRRTACNTSPPTLSKMADGVRE